MTFLPIVGRELRVRARKPSTRRVRLAAALIALVVAAVFSAQKLWTPVRTREIIHGQWLYLRRILTGPVLLIAGGQLVLTLAFWMILEAKERRQIPGEMEINIYIGVSVAYLLSYSSNGLTLAIHLAIAFWARKRVYANFRSAALGMSSKKPNRFLHRVAPMKIRSPRL